jgi:prevent-host-death family protein
MNARRASPIRWSLQDAKNKFSAVVDAAARGVPQVVTRRGVETVVVLSYAEFERLQSERAPAPRSFSDWLLDIPPAPGSGDEFERVDLGSPKQPPVTGR